MRDGGGVVDVTLALGKAHDGGDARGAPRHLFHGCLVLIEELRTQKKVLGRIPGQRKLGEGDQIRAQIARAGDGLDHLLGISGKIADGGIDLGQRKPDDPLGSGAGERIVGAFHGDDPTTPGSPAPPRRKGPKELPRQDYQRR